MLVEEAINEYCRCKTDHCYTLTMRGSIKGFILKEDGVREGNVAAERLKQYLLIVMDRLLLPEK